MQKVAMVTGATRGIGKAAALALAAKGFAVVVTGRTVREGEGNLSNEHEPMPIPGSIESTVAAIRAAGGEALGLRLDLLDRKSIDAAIDTIVARYGRLDVLLNNAVHQSPAISQPLAEFSMDEAERNFLGSVVNQMYITRRAVAVMRTNGGGRIIFVGSLTVTLKPNGMFGLLYSAGKAAFNKIPEFVEFEHSKDGIHAFLIEPQFTLTDTMRARYGDAAEDVGANTQARPPEATAATVVWLADHPDAVRFAGGGQMINAPDFFAINGIDPAAR